MYPLNLFGKKLAIPNVPIPVSSLDDSHDSLQIEENIPTHDDMMNKMTSEMSESKIIKNQNNLQ